MTAHLELFHLEKPSYECALISCESITSKFNLRQARLHLVTQHSMSPGLVYGDDESTFIDRVQRTQQGDVKTMRPVFRNERQRIRPCKVCTQKTAHSGFELQADGSDNGAEIVDSGTALA